MKKTPLVGILLAVTLITGGSAAYTALAAKPTKEDSRVLDSHTELEKLAFIWADAWKTREGKARYEIMNRQMKNEFREQQELMNGDPNSFVIRWSSPWVREYTVTISGERAYITYLYEDSTGERYQGSEELTYGVENGRVVITSCEALSEMKPV